MNQQDRDKRLIALFLAELNAWGGGTWKVARWPDIETRDAKAVDAIARDSGGCELAIEHTLLQPFTEDRADTVPFLKALGRLDRREDLAEANWMIDLIVDVGTIPKGVDWGALGEKIEAWFVGIRSQLKEGRTAIDVAGLTFPLQVTVQKSPLPDTRGCLFVMRTMPQETIDAAVQTALGAKVPKLRATPANERILLLELESPTRGNWEIGQAIEAAKFKTFGPTDVSGVWLAKTTAWESEGYIGFHLIWPLDRIVNFQEWRKARRLTSVCSRRRTI